MTLLGQFALWTALLLGVWGAVHRLLRPLAGRPELAALRDPPVLRPLRLLLVAPLSLWKGLITHDFNIEYVAALHLAGTCRPTTSSRRSGRGRRGRCSSGPLVLSLFARPGAVAHVARATRDLLPYVAGGHQRRGGLLRAR